MKSKLNPKVNMNKKASPKKSEVEEKATKSAALSLMNLNELREIKPAELQKMAISLEIEDAARMTRQDMIYAILKSQSDKQGEIYAEGVLEILSEGYGFLRSPKYLSLIHI